MDLYIYYRVREADCARAEPLARAMQRALAGAGIAGSLKRRADAEDGRQTWMEVYPETDAGAAAHIERACRDAGLADLIDGPRHTETFLDLAPCA